MKIEQWKGYENNLHITNLDNRFMAWYGHIDEFFSSRLVTTFNCRAGDKRRDMVF